MRAAGTCLVRSGSLGPGSKSPRLARKFQGPRPGRPRGTPGCPPGRTAVLSPGMPCAASASGGSMPVCESGPRGQLHENRSLKVVFDIAGMIQA